MENKDYICLDSKAFNEVIERKEELINRYNDLNTTYDSIVTNLLSNWKGKGATAFEKDANIVKKNIVGIFDILRIMCDTLTDCKEIFKECDTALGENNRTQQISASEQS